MKEIAGRRRFPLLERVALPACHPFQHLGIPLAGYDMGPGQRTKPDNNTEPKSKPKKIKALPASKQLSERRLICQFAEPSLTGDTIRKRGTDAHTRLFSFLFFFLSALFYWHRSEVAERELNFLINIIY